MAIMRLPVLPVATQVKYIEYPHNILYTQLKSICETLYEQYDPKDEGCWEMSTGPTLLVTQLYIMLQCFEF